VVFGSVTLTPPNGARNNWRVQVHHQGRRFDSAFGPSIAGAYRGYLAAEEWLIQQRSGRLGRPEFENTWLVEFIDDYVNRRGKDGQLTMGSASASVHL